MMIVTSARTEHSNTADEEITKDEGVLEVPASLNRVSYGGWTEMGVGGASRRQVVML